MGHIKCRDQRAYVKRFTVLAIDAGYYQRMKLHHSSIFSRSTVFAAIVGVASFGGCGGGGEATEPSAVVSAQVGTPTSVATLATSVPTAVSSATAGQNLPKAIAFTDRVGFIGNFRYLFKIELSKAEVVDVSGRRSLVISTRVTNLSNADHPITDVKAPSLVAADGSIIAAAWKINSLIPGGGTAPVDVVASVTEAFKFESVSLVFGNNASHQTTLPLNESVKVTTFAPVLSVGKTKTAAGGSGTVVTIIDGILHDDFTDGAKRKYQLELQVNIYYTHASNVAGNYEEVNFTLTAPDGTSSSPEKSYVFSSNDVDVIDTGKTSRLGLKFTIPSTYYGEYKLKATSRRASVYKDPGAVDPVLPFEVAQVR